MLIKCIVCCLILLRWTDGKPYAKPYPYQQQPKSKCIECHGKIHHPVCGADGNLYLNECDLKCNGVERAKGTVCIPDTDKCKCSRVFKPVCGRDGRTYGNKCYLKCAGTKKDYNGACQPCRCKPVMDPVCGTDGKTYDNECYLHCARVKKKKDGRCVCICPLIYKPVCGNDRKMYENDCLRQCRGVGLLKEGDCPPPPITPRPHDPCVQACPCFHFPICGADGHTYNNICHIECRKVAVHYYGVCKSGGHKKPLPGVRSFKKWPDWGSAHAVPHSGYGGY